MHLTAEGRDACCAVVTHALIEGPSQHASSQKRVLLYISCQHINANLKIKTDHLCVRVWGPDHCLSWSSLRIRHVSLSDAVQLLSFCPSWRLNQGKSGWCYSSGIANLEKELYPFSALTLISQWFYRLLNLFMFWVWVTGSSPEFSK